MVDLGAASSFAVLAGSAITFTSSPITLTGDIGSYPTPTITGIANVTFVSGADRSGDTALMTSAKSNLATAFGAITSQSATSGVTAFTNGAILSAGVYNIASAVTDITGTITLNGDASSIFIFKMSSTLITAPSSEIVFSGGALPQNTFWQVASSATLGASSHFGGNILAQTSISGGAGVMVDGRLLAQDGAITVGSGSVINAASVAVPEPSTYALLAGMLVLGMVFVRRLSLPSAVRG
jgi:type VI secretion system secreted protein VgrG